MAGSLKVGNATPQRISRVGNYSGFQGSNFNATRYLQPAAPAHIVQPAATARTLQPTYNPQRAATAQYVQPAATAARIRQAAEQMRVAVEAAAIRQKQIIRQQVQLKVDTGVASNKTKLTVSATAAAGQLKSFRGNPSKFKKVAWEDNRTDYDKAKAEAYWDAMAEFEKQRDGGKKSGFSKVWDKATFGQDRRDAAAREYAEKRSKEIMDRDFPQYEDRVNSYIKKQAETQNAVNAAALSMSQPQFEKFVAGKQAEIDKEYQELHKQAARYDGTTSAFDKASERKLTSAPSKTLSWVAKKASDDNPVWKYTLGGGSKNVPSVFTAPSRAVNFFGNINTKNRTIFQEGGTSINRDGSKLNAWQATQNQRSFNKKPWVDIAKGKQADSILGTEVQSLIAARRKMGVTDSNKLDYDKVMQDRLNSYNRSNRNSDSAFVVAADPVNALGFGAKLAAKGAAKAIPASFTSKLTQKVSSNNAFKWLTAEHKTNREKLSDAITIAKTKQDELQTSLMPRINELNKKLSQNEKFDVSVFDDLKGLTDWESKILQRSNAAGQLSRRDKLRLAGSKQTRERIENISAKWVDFSKKMAVADRVGGSQSRIYAPSTAWVHNNGKTLDDYDFRLHKKRKSNQTSADFRRSAIDRYWKSDVDTEFANVAKTKVARKKAERDELLRRYDDELLPVQAGVQKAYDKTRTLRGRVGNRLANWTPNAVWKKSVLKYRPAWYVNNALYNTQAAVLAGGSRALVEQAKMLRPKYYRKAVSEVPEEVRSNLAKEIGRDRVARFGNRVENWSRVAAFRAAKKSYGLNDKQALGRVNSYLFDYSVKNIERPIKATIPFWAWHKNLAKAGAKMPFDRPLAAQGYHRFDQYQQQQYDKDFNTMVPELQNLGYSEEEIAQFREENAKYFRGKLKVGNKYITTPFNAFSEKQMSQFGINPFLSATRETAESVDSFGQPIAGAESSFKRRILSKFPQLEIARQYKRKRDLEAGRLQPSKKYIGKEGGEGYGLGKEKQGYDPSKSNYVESMDPRRKLGQNALAFLGKPRDMQFDKSKFVKNKLLNKVTDQYFSTDWKGMGWDESQKQQAELFKKFGISADDFFKGVLSKYDTDNTTRIKGMKEAARAKNNSLFDEYGKQPRGTRSTWAVKKLQELIDSGYYKDNPFLTGFVKSSFNEKGLIDPASISKTKTGAAKKAAYQYAKSTGDWSKYRAAYGTKRSQKALDRDKAVASGNWNEYRAKYGTKYSTKSTSFAHNGKFFKSSDTKQKYIDGEFWRKYVAADKGQRKQLLAANPQYNKRGNWTDQQWDVQKKTVKEIQKSKLMQFGTAGQLLALNIENNKKGAARFKSTKKGRAPKISYRLS